MRTPSCTSLSPEPEVKMDVDGPPPTTGPDSLQQQQQLLLQNELLLQHQQWQQRQQQQQQQQQQWQQQQPSPTSTSPLTCQRILPPTSPPPVASPSLPTAPRLHHLVIRPPQGSESSSGGCEFASFRTGSLPSLTVIQQLYQRNRTPAPPKLRHFSAALSSRSETMTPTPPAAHSSSSAVYHLPTTPSPSFDGTTSATSTADGLTFVQMTQPSEWMIIGCGTAPDNLSPRSGVLRFDNEIPTTSSGPFDLTSTGAAVATAADDRDLNVAMLEGIVRIIVIHRRRFSFVLEFLFVIVCLRTIRY